MREKLCALLSWFVDILALLFPLLVVRLFFSYINSWEKFISFPFEVQVFYFALFGLCCWFGGDIFVSHTRPAIKHVVSWVKDLFKRPDAPVNEN